MGSAVFFRCFQNEWDGAVFGKVSKGFEAVALNESLANVAMAVDAAAQFFDGVVEMKAGKGVDADVLVVLFQCLFDAFWCRDVVAGCPYMRSVQARFESRGKSF